MTKAAPGQQHDRMSTLRSRLRRACSNSEVRRLLVGLYLLMATEIWLLGSVAGRLSGDSTSYLALADSLLAGRGMVEPSPDGGFLPNLIRPPGYPAFLACLQLLFGRTLEAPVLAQAALICLSIETVRRRLARSVGPPASTALPAIAMLFPGFLVHAGRISSEAPATFLLTLGLELFLRRRDRAGHSLVVGATLALGCLFRQNLIVAIPLLGWIQWLSEGKGRADAWKLLAGATLVLGPWAVHNYRLSGVVSPVSALPEQFRFTYHADVLAQDAHMRARWQSNAIGKDAGDRIGLDPIKAASGLRLRAYRRSIEQCDLHSFPGAVAILSGGACPWDPPKSAQFLHALNEETLKIVEDLGVGRVLASRLLYGIPRTWFTGPETYPPGLSRWIGVILAALQLGILAALWVGAGHALRTTTTLVSILMLALVCGDILRYPAGTMLTVPILGFLAARAGTASSVWTAVSLQLLVVLSARHAEFRYVTTHYPVILALVIEAVTRCRTGAGVAESLQRRPAPEQLKSADR